MWASETPNFCFSVAFSYMSKTMSARANHSARSTIYVGSLALVTLSLAMLASSSMVGSCLTVMSLGFALELVTMS